MAEVKHVSVYVYNGLQGFATFVRFVNVVAPELCFCGRTLLFARYAVNRRTSLHECPPTPIAQSKDLFPRNAITPSVHHRAMPSVLPVRCSYFNLRRLLNAGNRDRGVDC